MPGWAACNLPSVLAVTTPFTALEKLPFSSHRAPSAGCFFLHLRPSPALSHLFFSPISSPVSVSHLARDLARCCAPSLQISTLSRTLPIARSLAATVVK